MIFDLIMSNLILIWTFFYFTMATPTAETHQAHFFRGCSLVHLHGGDQTINSTFIFGICKNSVIFD